MFAALPVKLVRKVYRIEPMVALANNPDLQSFQPSSNCFSAPEFVNYHPTAAKNRDACQISHKSCNL
jgi:hypothetical protein